jgi:hypothetical protein
MMSSIIMASGDFFLDGVVARFFVLDVHGVKGPMHGAASTRAKCFLSAYAIKYFPSSVFSMLGPTEMDLFKSAQLVLDEFQEVIERTRDAKSFAKISIELSMLFCEGVSCLFETFRKW